MKSATGSSKAFSTGMKQRVKLAQSIVHDPSLVFLDEPTAGLDPPGRDDMLELVDRIHNMMGMTVVLSSHILEDIERVCDYVVIINEGQLVLAQTIGGTPADGAALSITIDGDAQAFIARLNALGIDDVRLRDRMTGFTRNRHPRSERQGLRRGPRHRGRTGCAARIDDRPHPLAGRSLSAGSRRGSTRFRNVRRGVRWPIPP